MRNYALKTESEVKDKKRSFRLAMTVHAIAAGLLLIPITSQIDIPLEPALKTMVLVDFNDFKAASAKSSTKEGVEKETETVEEPVVEEVVEEVAEPEPEKPVDPVKEAPAPVVEEAT
ncbi:MAG: hypothetical protein HKN16_06155, partial [Saprospiraceae bacterium]|nr:hypothetical protein [Saprospiraceae bacterium]